MPNLKLPQLNYLLEEFPEQFDFVSRLDNFIFKQPEPISLTLKEVIDILQPTNLRVFTLILNSIEKSGFDFVTFHINVKAPSGENVDTFKSIMDIPETLIDPHNQESFTVLLPHAEAFYNFTPPNFQKNKQFKM